MRLGPWGPLDKSGRVRQAGRVSSGPWDAVCPAGRYLQMLPSTVHPFRPHMICTVGYQLRSPGELVEHLVGAGVDVVVDVRETPWSQRPAYRKTALARALGEAGIEYLHAPFAGNPKRLRREAKSHAECLDLYSAYLVEHPEVGEQFAQLMASLVHADRKACLLCYERHPHDCHRTRLLDAVGLSAGVEHLGTEGAPRFLKA
jgi:uncharacterized protein (DUF488 family)